MEDRRKINKQSTGTVPKVKYRNNTTYAVNERERLRTRNLTNNLASYWQHSGDSSNLIRNPRRSQRTNYFVMDTTLEEPLFECPQNGSVNFNQSVNGTVTPDTNSSTSRRNSYTLKCDNVTKYPDKKQIEDKLHQIQEYLKATNALMSNWKNTDDRTNDQTDRESLEKMSRDLKDSEKKLLGILDQINLQENGELVAGQHMENAVDDISERNSSSRRNGADSNLINPNQDIDVLRKLQHTAEDKLREARLRESLHAIEINTSNRKGNKSYAEYDFDVDIKELEERARRLRTPSQVSNQKTHENILAKVESLHNEIVAMHNANDEREHLIEALDNHDADLRLRHAELQTKLHELQTKKSQVDELVVQIQSCTEEEEEDVGGQVRKIMTMKDQLRNLKDMLEQVKTTENTMENSNSAEARSAAYEIYASAENFLEKDVKKPRLQSQVQNEANILRTENFSSNDIQPKEINKISTEQGYRGVKPKITSYDENLYLQAALAVKKKELEEIMGKQKASTSNLNQDIRVDVSAQSQADSDRLSSDDGQEYINDYSEMYDNHNLLNLPKSKKFRSLSNDDSYIQPSEFERAHGTAHTSERNVRSNSVATSGYIREYPRSNTEHENRTQLEKQLHLIRSVCDSVLEQQATINQQSNVQHLRNNLTPSPVYPEHRRFTSSRAHTFNSTNVGNPTSETPRVCQNDYQHCLSRHAIQTQSLMLNTVNQCCQMLSVQQRELLSLRSVVNSLQERLDNNAYEGHSTEITPSFQTSQDYHHPYPQFPHVPNRKINHHVSAAYSLPNLSLPPQCNAPPSNRSLNFINQNNVQSGRLLDPSLNNGDHLNTTQGDHTINNTLHDVNSNINQSLPNQMWNGQALNNQVAPGNRANNYWDNFRSYSRQNLLSTKNNEVLQNPCLDRLNTVNKPINPFSLMSLSKSNSEQCSTNFSQENTPQRRGPSFCLSRHRNANISVIPPPDVLNINHNNKMNSQLDLPSSTAHQVNGEDVNADLQMLLNSYNETCSNHSNIPEGPDFQEMTQEQLSKKNGWNDEVNEEQLPKTKLFDELKENVYKEVASLISANETRPHFLIQLFRDLQMIGSDLLRLKILQSIQMVITHSLMPSQISNKHSLDSHQICNDHENSQASDYTAFQSTIWSKPMKKSAVATKNKTVNTEIENTFKAVIPFLNDHEGEIIQSAILLSLKRIILTSENFKEIVKDVVFQKHFSNVLDDVLEQYRGKNILDVKIHLMQTLNDLLHGELSFIQLIEETNPEQCFTNCISDANQTVANFSADVLYEAQNKNSTTLQATANVQNGDLAEADQSRAISDAEEEGAVGGILDDTQSPDIKTAIQNTCLDVDLNVDFSCNIEGLDEIPTRLPTKIKSRSTTPNKGEEDL